MSSSSSEQEKSYTFRSADLPLISLPSSHSSSSNSSESDTPPLFTPSNTLAFTMPGPQIDSATELSTSIEPPTESPSSPTELGLTFSRVELCSQTSADNADLSSSNTSGVGKRRIHKTNTGRFQKGVGIKRKTPVTPTIRKRSQLASRNPCYFRKSNFLGQTHVSASKFVRMIRYRFAIYWYLMGRRYLTWKYLAASLL